MLELSLLKNTITLFVIFLISIYIIIQLLLITDFNFKYINNMDYGNTLKKVCKNNYLEYETGRFQLYTNIIKSILSNDDDNIINYILILSIILIFTILISCIVTYILYTYISDIKKNYDGDNDIFKTILNVLLILTCSISLIYIPLYIGYNFDINNENSLNSFNKIINYVEFAFIILIGINLYLNYLNYNKDKDYSHTDSFVIFSSILLLLCIYLTKSIISYYKNKNQEINFKKNNKNKIELLLDNNTKYDNIISNYIYDIFYLSNNDKRDYIYYLIVILIIIFILLLFNKFYNIYLYYNSKITFDELIKCLFYLQECNNTLFYKNEISIIFNFVIVSIVVILVILVIINSTIYFNKNINNNIIKEPLLIYKSVLNDINKNFNNVIENDKIEYTIKNSTSKNIANSILLVLYNEIFSNYLTLEGKDKKTEDNKILYDQYLKDISIIPKFDYDFKNSIQKIDYNISDEYNINNYIINKCDIDLLKNNSINRNCKDNNVLLIYYILRKIFLYKPIADIEKDEKKLSDSYNYYKNIIKYKIYTAINNYDNDMNYLGTNKIDNNNHEINCRLDILNKDPEITKEELVEELNKIIFNAKYLRYRPILTNNINLNSEKDEILIQITSATELDNIKNNIELVNDLNKLSKYLDNSKIQGRINEIKRNNSSIKIYEKLIDNIIDQYINYIIEIQQIYFVIYKCNDSDDSYDCDNIDEIDISIQSIENNMNNQKSKLNYFVNNYKKKLKNNFDKINKLLTDFNPENNYSTKNKLNKYIKYNYNVVNEKELKNYLQYNIRNINLSNNEIKQDKNIIVNELIYSILISLLYNDYFIINIKNKYNDEYLDALVDKIKKAFTEESSDKTKYLSDIGNLSLILNYNLNNDILKLNEDKIKKIINNNNINNYIIEKIKDINDEHKIDINDRIEILKKINKNTNKVNEFDESLYINSNYIDNTLGIKNKIELLFNYNKLHDLDNKKEMEILNDLYTNQKIILNKINNILNIKNFNKLLKNIDYENKFNENLNKIKELKIITYESEEEKEEIIEVNKDYNKLSLDINRNISSTSYSIYILIIIYIISYYVLIKLR